MGYVSVDLTSADSVQLTDLRLSGPMDTEVRFSLDLARGRLVTFVTSILPTGQQAVLENELPLLVALTDDAIGFATTSLGTGGSLGAGFSAAFPVGRFAVGAAATGVYAFPYQPVLGAPVNLQPGGEVRVRLGLEGSLAARSYLRLAGSVAARQQDQIGGTLSHGVGHRIIGLVTVDQGLGPALLGLYAFDVFRGSPQLEQTAFGAAVLPRGNLLAGGGHLTLPIGRRTSFMPRAEYRIATAAQSIEDTRLFRQSSALRVGADLRQRIGSNKALVIQGDGVRGEVLQGPALYGFTGFRAAVHLELTP